MEILLVVKCTVVSENKKVIDGKVQVNERGEKGARTIRKAERKRC